ncbi:MAG: hypothetical protein A3J30_01530 [Candidatus Wildermuthbacteria bacterium RIFCSPLOWO2_02_FULL_47_9c]|uniref:DoxX family protein n=2 Tax=Parcubacteria group TaxID=1794811 RepID=A0A837IKF4_9BACT|nr:MAG: hypothetical protein UY25_C0006G0014 [Candidatus Yanofskybacteria bacterium GW2011_GWC1_48_11]KKW03378.1 MAG: hypothetical protein UY38_C0004G0004 [Parcubacteria group bacterium GW2011_GWB1_49_12]KKW08308.1 MAG: hypothetical protein UY45_C0009G0007 [Parcubacteria group bacterium GW2011_GWA1_49_26]KKW13308.1 MAG: hypothetical protein UY53_C0015G0008 [Parcubacteria group bacterium GW2011_GWA2_50_10]OHA61890.1 MAG: hypothetical protein A2109_02970 [Candidatus Wildermuthbacteria bacterium G
MNTKLIEWVLRVSVAGEFLGHGVFALQGKEAWIKWIQELLRVEVGTATTLLTLVGLLDLLVALIVLVRPIKAVVLWAVIWGFWTALVRPVVGEPIWDFVERWANWGAPLALLLLLGLPKSFKGWIK